MKTFKNYLSEKDTSYRERLYKRELPKRKRHLRKRGGRNTSSDRHVRTAPSHAQSKKISRLSRSYYLQQKFPGINFSKLSKYAKNAIQDMIALDRNAGKESRKKLKKRFHRADLARLSRPDDRYKLDTTGGVGKLNASVSRKKLNMILEKIDPFIKNNKI